MPFDKIYWLEDWEGKAQGGFYYRDDFFKSIKKFEQEFKKKVVGIRIEDGWNIEFICADNSPHNQVVSSGDTQSPQRCPTPSVSLQKESNRNGEESEEPHLPADNVQSRELSEEPCSATQLNSVLCSKTDSPDICKCGKEIYFLDGVWWHSGTDRVYCHRNTVAEPQGKKEKEELEYWNKVRSRKGHVDDNSNGIKERILWLKEKK